MIRHIGWCAHCDACNELLLGEDFECLSRTNLVKDLLDEGHQIHQNGTITCGLCARKIAKGGGKPDFTHRTCGGEDIGSPMSVVKDLIGTGTWTALEDLTPQEAVGLVAGKLAWPFELVLSAVIRGDRRPSDVPPEDWRATLKAAHSEVV